MTRMKKSVCVIDRSNVFYSIVAKEHIMYYLDFKDNYECGTDGQAVEIFKLVTWIHNPEILDLLNDFDAWADGKRIPIGKKGKENLIKRYMNKQFKKERK